MNEAGEMSKSTDGGDVIVDDHRDRIVSFLEEILIAAEDQNQEIMRSISCLETRNMITRSPYLPLIP